MTRRIALAVTSALLAPVLLVGCGRDQPPVVGAQAVEPAERSAPLELAGTTLDGAPLDVATLRGRVVVVNSWASWCAPCREEMPALVELSRGADPDQVVVLGLNVTDDPEAAKDFVAEFAMPFPSIEDADGALLATIPGVPPASLPSTVILDPDGRVAARIIGAADGVQLVSMVAQVLDEYQRAGSA